MAPGKELERRPGAEVGTGRPFIENVIIENAQLIFRNFKGREGMYNREGDRNFCVILSAERAAQLEEIGWNVKYLKPREEGDEPTPYIQVSVGYKIRPPRVSLITSRGKADLGEDEIEAVDYVDIEYADVIFRPYQYSVSGRSGIKAYLKTLFVKIQEDYLELKYSEVPDILPMDGEGLELEIMGGGKPDEGEEDYSDMDIVDAELVEE